MMPWHLYLMAGAYIVAGTFHFTKPRFYVRVMPKYIPNHRMMVFLTGALEILLGILICFPLTKNLALLGIILMLVVFLSVHFYMLSSKEASAGIPSWILILRIPLQFGLMYWAFSYIS